MSARGSWSSLRAHGPVDFGVALHDGSVWEEDSMHTITLKRGATLRMTLCISHRGLGGADITAQARCGDVISDLAVRVMPLTEGWVEISAPADVTADWPLSDHASGAYIPTRCDIRIAWSNGDVAYSETMFINVLPEVTSDA